MKRHSMTRYLLLSCAYALLCLQAGAQGKEPLRLAVAGVSHGHLWEVIKRLDRGDFTSERSAGSTSMKAAVRKEIAVTPDDLSSLENNRMVVRILDAAIQSSKTKTVVRFQ